MSTDDDHLLFHSPTDRRDAPRANRVEALVTDDFELSDAATGSTLRGPEALRHWLATAVDDLTPDTGRLDLRFAEIVEFRDGKIARMRAYPDTATFLGELGLLPRVTRGRNP